MVIAATPKRLDVDVFFRPVFYYHVPCYAGTDYDVMVRLAAFRPDSYRFYDFVFHSQPFSQAPDIPFKLPDLVHAIIYIMNFRNFRIRKREPGIARLEIAI